MVKISNLPVFSLDSNLITHSCNLADDFLNQNELLENLLTKSVYNQRFSAFSALGVSEETGYTSFTPEMDGAIIESQFSLLISDGWDYLQNHAGLPDGMFSFLRKDILDLHTSMKYIGIDAIINRDLSRCTELLEKIRKCKEAYKGHIEFFKKFPSSPKLTKVLSYMYGSASGGVMDWLTTKAPRSFDDFRANDYRVYISVLPNHIAGMSYYSSYNFGGDSWDGQNGTSCQDPKREGNSLINHLPASIGEQTLAVAWLALKDHDNMESPIMQARALIRYIPGGAKPVFLMCRRYGTGVTSKSLLQNGLLKRFSEMIDADSVNKWSSDAVEIEVYMNHFAYDAVTRESCSHCDGEGKVDEQCEECEGTGRLTVTCDTCCGSGEVPNENDEYEECPDCYGGGYVEAACSDCDGDGYDNVECHYCDGDGYTVESETENPYIDDSNALWADGSIVCYHINTLLLEGAGYFASEVITVND